MGLLDNLGWQLKNQAGRAVRNATSNLGGTVIGKLGEAVLGSRTQVPVGETGETAPQDTQAKICSCGSPIAPGKKFCPSCGKPAAPVPTFCGSCGAKLNGTKFCGECGQPV